MVFNGLTLKWGFSILGILLTLLSYGQNQNHYYQHLAIKGTIQKEVLLKDTLLDVGLEFPVTLEKRELVQGYLQEEEKRFVVFTFKCQDRRYLRGALDWDEAALLVKLAAGPKPDATTSITFTARHYSSVELEYIHEKFILYLGSGMFSDEERCTYNWEEFQKIAQVLKELL